MVFLDPKALTEDAISALLQLIEDERKKRGTAVTSPLRMPSEPLSVQVAACIVALCGWAARLVEYRLLQCGIVFSSMHHSCSYSQTVINDTWFYFDKYHHVMLSMYLHCAYLVLCDFLGTVLNLF